MREQVEPRGPGAKRDGNHEHHQGHCGARDGVSSGIRAEEDHEPVGEQSRREVDDADDDRAAPDPGEECQRQPDLTREANQMATAMPITEPGTA